MNIDYFQDELNLKVSIQSDIFKEIEEKCADHAPNEFGGILLGTYDEQFKTAVITKTLFPKEFDNSPVEFVRYAEDLNAEISEIYNQSNGEVIYLGEWHSHPNMAPKYSITDFKVMTEIANDEGISIANPILLIIGGEPSNLTSSVYAYFKDDLYLFKLLIEQ